ncbi:ribosomal-protein-alanine N-acetyltransferase [Rossellomorea vietnamensis]|uniref:[Ribosomal protein bS18]-alanine N-acetyltransferase n=1 Tax=Rossellomorea vietnamensis TaxID=218284 RepID=A0A5D4M8K4_9BACI|nr:ribosomal protein S18-alanine N-acetyltransferase [Rossellomorea vietnamensis]TYR97375.1 ribosomal-protein-alanine N-acetyltransferase [Rossellomorea vietnamensis]
MSDYTIRLMSVEDLDDIMEVERESFTIPWTRDAFQNEIETNHFATYIVMEDKGRVIGYCGVWIIVDEAHITNIAVLPSYRGQGLGDKLLKSMIEIAKEMGARTMTLEVRVSNSPAQSLYRKFGFMDGGIRKNYYSDNQEDALVMWVKLYE